MILQEVYSSYIIQEMLLLETFIQIRDCIAQKYYFKLDNAIVNICFNRENNKVERQHIEFTNWKKQRCDKN